MATRGKSNGTPKGTTAITVLEDDFGLTRDLPNADRWINPPGNAIASRGQVELWKRGYFEGIATLLRVRDGADATQGELLHGIGTYLREIRGHSAWKTVGIETWELYCKQELETSHRHANRLVAFAGAVSKQEAAYGVRKCLAGLRIAEKLGLGKVADLVLKEGATEPAKWEQVMGEPVRFLQSPAARLERLAAGGGHVAPPPVPPTRRTKAIVADRKEVIGQVSKKHPALDSLGVRSFAKDGEARISHRPASTDGELAGLAALYAALVKR